MVYNNRQDAGFGLNYNYSGADRNSIVDAWGSWGSYNPLQGSNTNQQGGTNPIRPPQQDPPKKDPVPPKQPTNQQHRPGIIPTDNRQNTASGQSFFVNSGGSQAYSGMFDPNNGSTWGRADPGFGDFNSTQGNVRNVDNRAFVNGNLFNAQPASSTGGTNPFFSAANQGAASSWMQTPGESLAANGSRAGSSAVSGGGSGGGSASQAAQNSREDILRLTEGYGDDVLNDPYIMAVVQKLQEAMNGGGPFTDEIQQSLLNQQSDMAAAANVANAGAFRGFQGASGGSIRDPSGAARNQEFREQRQLQNLQSANEIGTQAAISNYQAQQQAAANLAAARQGQLAQVGALRSDAANFLRGDVFEGDSGGASGGSGPGTVTSTPATSPSNPVAPGSGSVSVSGGATAKPGAGGALDAPQGQGSAAKGGMQKPFETGDVSFGTDANGNAITTVNGQTIAAPAGTNINTDTFAGYDNARNLQVAASLGNQVATGGMTAGQAQAMATGGEMPFHVPSHVRNLGAGRYYDTKSGRVLGVADMERMYGGAHPDAKASAIVNSWMVGR